MTSVTRDGTRVRTVVPERAHADPVELQDLRERLGAAERTTAQLAGALTSNRRLGIAIGVLMSRHGLTPEQGIRFLRRVSQERNVKVRELAEQVIGSWRPDATSLVTDRDAPVPPRDA